MPVLLALSVLAFVALLWATISIAGFVRRARRRRRRRAADGAGLAANSIAPRARAPEPLFYADPEARPASAPPGPAQVLPLQTSLPHPAQEPALNAEEISRPALDPVPCASVSAAPISSAQVSPVRMSSPPDEGVPVTSVVASVLPPDASSGPMTASPDVPLAETLPAGLPSTEAAPPPPRPAESQAAPPPPRLRSFPTRLGKHTMAAPGAEDSWPQWATFNNDFADLTDPAPSRRVAAATRSRNKESRH